MSPAGESLGEDPREPGYLERSRRRRFGLRLGRYRLGTLVGAGGAAAVYMARLDGPHRFERILALKLVHEHLLADRSFVTMFLDEANLAVRLSHPNIVHTYELGHADDSLFIAMEYLQGQTLSRLYQRAHQLGEPLPFGVVAWIGARAAEALHYAHELADDSGMPLNIVHRDVSPDNLFVTYDGQVKLLDFGIARAERRLGATKLGQVKGKFRYMSAEYALGESFDRTLDLFALGATLYEAALGVPAFEGEDESAVLESVLLGEVTAARAIRPDFPEPLWQTLEQALSRSPAARFADGQSFALALAASASPDARAELGRCMRRLFAAEIRAETNDLTELRGITRDGSDSPTAQGHALTTHSLQRSPARGWSWGLGALALGMIAATLWVLGPGAEHAPGAAASGGVPAAPGVPAAASVSVPASAFAPAPVPPLASGVASAPAVSPPTATPSISARSESRLSAPRRAAPAAAPTGLIKRYPF